MAWIRLSDDYNDHPKFNKLSDGAFRLWHQGIGFCRKYQTDGLLPFDTVRCFKSYSPKRMTELQTPWRAGENALWQEIEGFGVSVHDYLQWNPSKDEENERRAESKERMRQTREQRRSRGVAPPVRANTLQTSIERSHDVPGREGKEALKGELSLDERAGRLREELYPAWYRKYRNGACLMLTANSLEFQDAQRIVATWDDARIEKLAKIVLITEDPFISGTDRSFRIFAMKASWADDRLRQAEAARAS